MRNAQQVGGLLVQFEKRAVRKQSQRSANGGQRCPQLMAHGRNELILEPVQRITLAYIAEAEHRPREPAVIENRRNRVVHAEGAAVDPENGIFAGRGHQLQPGGSAQQRAIVSAFAAFWRRAMQKVVYRMPRQAGCRCAQHARRRGVGKADQAVAVQAADSVGHRVE